MPRFLTILFFMTTVFAWSSSATNSLSSLLDKRGKYKASTMIKDDCNNELEVSAICYNCAALWPSDFHVIHGKCCAKPGPVRNICIEWYTEEPKRAQRNKYY